MPAFQFLSYVMLRDSPLSIGRIVIGVNGKKTQELSVAVSYSACFLRNAEAVNAPAARASTRKDCFPAQAFVAIQLLPIQLFYFSKGSQNGQGLFSLQG